MSIFIDFHNLTIKNNAKSSTLYWATCFFSYLGDKKIFLTLFDLIEIYMLSLINTSLKL